MHTVDPLAGQIGEGREVLLRHQPACLEATHLAWRCRRARSRLAADDPAHRRIMPQALGIVDIFISDKPSEHRLPQQPDQSVTAIPTGACVGEHVPGHRAETEGVVEFTVGQQCGIGGDPGAMELELQPAVEIEPQRALDRFTRRVRHLAQEVFGTGRRYRPGRLHVPTLAWSDRGFLILCILDIDG
jgi:hypothetical protein